MRRVVITGIGMVTPFGNCVETWEGVKSGKSAITQLEFGYDITPYKSAVKDDVSFPAFGGQCKKFTFNPQELGIDPEKGKKLDRTAQLAVVAAHDAIYDARIDLTKETKPVGVIIGSAYGGSETIREQDEILFGHRYGAEMGRKKVSTFLIPRIISSGMAAHVGIVLGAKGPTHAVNAACASGAVGIGELLWMIRSGRIDVGLGGGAEAGITPQILGGYASLGVYSSRDVDPSKAMCPYDRRRDGFVASEGAGIVVLEEYEHAMARGAHIYGELIGYGTNADAFHITRPDAERLRECIDLAAADAGINLAEVKYINAHGTSTPIGDVNEVIAITKAFEKCVNKPLVSSNKSELGHMIGATGAVELILTLLSMRDGVAPPTINLECPDPECDGLDFIVNVARDISIDVALSINYGFGGLNACLLLRKV